MFFEIQTQTTGTTNMYNKFNYNSLLLPLLQQCLITTNGKINPFNSISYISLDAVIEYFTTTAKTKWIFLWMQVKMYNRFVEKSTTIKYVICLNSHESSD